MLMLFLYIKSVVAEILRRFRNTMLLSMRTNLPYLHLALLSQESSVVFFVVRNTKRSKPCNIRQVINYHLFLEPYIFLELQYHVGTKNV